MLTRRIWLSLRALGPHTRPDEVVVGQNLARVQAQQGHELIFVLRQLRVDTRDIDAVLVIVDEQVAGLKFTGVGKLIVGGQRAGMAESRADAGEQLLGAEGFVR